MTVAIKLILKFEGKFRNLSAKTFDESTTFGLDSYWNKHDKHNNVTFGLNSYWYKKCIY